MNINEQIEEDRRDLLEMHKRTKLDELEGELENPIRHSPHGEAHERINSEQETKCT